MLIEAMYYVIFFDVEKPKDDRFAMKKRVKYSKYMNLIDKNIPDKEVELDGVQYKIIDFVSFSIINSVDNHRIVVFNVEKIKK